MKFKRQTKLSHGIEMIGFGEVLKKDNNGEGPGTVVVAGLANRFVVDRGKDIIELDAWDLENFKKNPVILFNHGMDPQLGGTPIGKAVEVYPTEEGLFIKAEISNVDDPVINRIRGLVKEKILRAFSVGFDSQGMEADKKDGTVNRIKQAELFEVSIVGVPMNQDSLFEVSGKMIKRKSLSLLRRDILKRKGAVVASQVQVAMSKSSFSREEIQEKVCEKSGMTSDELVDVLAGNIEMPENVLNAFAEVLNVKAEILKQEDLEDSEESEDFEEKTIESEDEKQADQDVIKNDSQIAAANTETENNDFGSPFLDALKQNNVLMGALINEVQLMSSKLDKVELELEEEKEQSEEENVIIENSEEELDEDPQMESTSLSVETSEEEAGEAQEDEEQSRKRVDEYVKRLNNITDRLDMMNGKA